MQKYVCCFSFHKGRHISLVFYVVSPLLQPPFISVCAEAVFLFHIFSILSLTKCSFYPNSQSPYVLFTSTLPSSGKLNMDIPWPEPFFMHPMHPMLLDFSIFLWALQPSGSVLCLLVFAKTLLGANHIFFRQIQI